MHFWSAINPWWIHTFIWLSDFFPVWVGSDELLVFKFGMWYIWQNVHHTVFYLSDWKIELLWTRIVLKKAHVWFLVVCCLRFPVTWSYNSIGNDCESKMTRCCSSELRSIVLGCYSFWHGFQNHKLLMGLLICGKMTNWTDAGIKQQV